MNREKSILKAKELGKQLPPRSLYGNVFKNNPDNIEEVLFEVAQQANSNEITRNNIIETLGKEIVDIAVGLFPNTKVGDKYKQ